MAERGDGRWLLQLLPRKQVLMIDISTSTSLLSTPPLPMYPSIKLSFAVAMQFRRVGRARVRRSRVLVPIQPQAFLLPAQRVSNTPKGQPLAGPSQVSLASAAMGSSSPGPISREAAAAAHPIPFLRLEQLYLGVGASQPAFGLSDACSHTVPLEPAPLVL